MHVGIGTIMPEVSEGFCQPLPALAVPDATLNVGTGRVGIGPVGVYEGRSVAAPPLVIEVGGHAYCCVNVAGI